MRLLEMCRISHYNHRVGRVSARIFPPEPETVAYVRGLKTTLAGNIVSADYVLVKASCGHKVSSLWVCNRCRKCRTCCKEDVHASKNLPKHLCPNCRKVAEQFRADRKAYDNRMTLRMAIGFLVALVAMFVVSLLRGLVVAIH